MMDAECYVEDHLRRRDSLWPPSRFAHEQAHLLVARPTNSLLIGIFANRATDLCGAERLSGEPFDLPTKPRGNPRREESH